MIHDTKCGIPIIYHSVPYPSFYFYTFILLCMTVRTVPGIILVRLDVLNDTRMAAFFPINMRADMSIPGTRTVLIEPAESGRGGAGSTRVHTHITLDLVYPRG